MASLVFSAAGNTSFSAASVTDGLQIEALSQYVSAEKSLLEDGDIEISKAPGETLQLIVILNGTQIAILTESQSEEFLNKFPDLFDKVQSTGMGASQQGIFSKYFSSFESVKRLGAWKEGVIVRPGAEAVFSGALMLKAQFEVEMIKKIGPLWVGAAGGYKGYIQGELPAKIRSQNDSYGPASSLPVVAKGIVAIPWVKVEIEYDGNYLPEYHWLQENDKVYWNMHDYKVMNGSDRPSTMDQLKDIDSLLQYNLPVYLDTAGVPIVPSDSAWEAEKKSRLAKSEGSVIDYFGETGGAVTERSPLTITGTLKLGVFHYAFIYSGSYKTPLHRIYVDDLELFIGKWGMGVISSTTDEGKMTFVPGVWVDVYEFNLKAMNAGVIKWSPLKLYFHKLKRSFLMGMTTTFRFDFAK